MTITEVVQSGDGRLINEAIASASLTELKSAYRELLAKNQHPEVIKALETAIETRQKLVRE